MSLGLFVGAYFTDSFCLGDVFFFFSPLLTLSILYDTTGLLEYKRGTNLWAGDCMWAWFIWYQDTQNEKKSILN